ncbi:hypothetical protein [Bradyrhizobium sp. 141]|uniref:hypothetical protein n=1 Tax=Bradyrhizobium sp. 141 TaxID=2782617 RepID=UPI001FFBF672|nr:hypothetical protein [Bradyrhizobium sp. 141]MCK1721320.1 hypothetical protein [Bradyrhizobium sp. 141]
MTAFPLPDILHRMIAGELEQLQSKCLLARSETAERLAIASEMLWRSQQLLTRAVKDEGSLSDHP